MPQRRELTLLLALLVAGCTAQSFHKPSEVLDSRTGMTVGALQAPLAFTERGVFAPLDTGRRPSVAYLGPVEWDRSGDFTYGLWVGIAPGDGTRLIDFRAEGCLTLTLDDGPVSLSVIEAPEIGTDPYSALAAGGQTAYFGVDVPVLKRMAASRSLLLSLRGADLVTVDFVPAQQTNAVLTGFIQSRNLAER
jgi:hypothetical protein